MILLYSGVARQHRKACDDLIQLMHSFLVNIRICQPEKVMSTSGNN